jgi:flagellar motor switch protein FliN/FliY
VSDGLSQDDIEALIAGETAGEATADEPVVETPAAGGGAMSQEAIEALLAGEGDEPEAEADEAEVVAETPAAGGGSMSQAEIEALLAGDTEADHIADAASPRATDAPLTPDEIAALIAAESDGGAFEAAPPVRPAPAAMVHAPVVEEIAYTELPSVQGPIDEVADIRLLMDVPLQITVELGQATRTIRELLEIGQGSILHLSRHAGEPVDVLVNGQAIAKGEVVVIDENFGIRVTEVVSPADRLRSMAA